MSSWKLLGAAIKAQRTWANLSPEQKEQVRKTASRAAKNAYARMQEPSTQPEAARPEQDAPPPQAGATTGNPAEDRASAAPATSAAAALAGLAREHGPRLARQAAVRAAARSQGRAGQLVALWKRTQRPPQRPE